MCLIIDKDEHPKYKCKIARDDIYCYKTIEKDKNGNYCSMFTHRKKWIENKLYTNKTKTKIHKWEVTEGCYHSFVDRNKAENFAYNLSSHRGIVALCMIPKGSEYYWGWCKDMHCFGYASKQLKIVKIYDYRRLC